MGSGVQIALKVTSLWKSNGYITSLALTQIKSSYCACWVEFERWKHLFSFLNKWKGFLHWGVHPAAPRGQGQTAASQRPDSLAGTQTQKHTFSEYSGQIYASFYGGHSVDAAVLMVFIDPITGRRDFSPREEGDGRLAAFPWANGGVLQAAEEESGEGVRREGAGRLDRGGTRERELWFIS